MRWVVLLTAPLFILGWLLMDSKLSPQQASETEAMVSYITRKQVEYVRLLTQQHGEIEVSCRQARELCDRGRPQKGAQLLVRVQNTGIFSGWWLVTAQHNGEPIVTLEVQSSDYRQAKIMWGLGALAFATAAFVLWRFAPFGPPRHEA